MCFKSIRWKNFRFTWLYFFCWKIVEIDESCLKCIYDNISIVKNIEILNLGSKYIIHVENRINEDGILVLCKILLELSDLKELIIEENEISLEDLNTLFDVLKCFNNLKYVNIRGIIFIISKA